MKVVFTVYTIILKSRALSPPRELPLAYPRASYHLKLPNEIKVLPAKYLYNCQGHSAGCGGGEGGGVKVVYKLYVQSLPHP